MPAYSRILLPWDSQPQEPVGVDLNNPLMRGVVEVYVPPWMGGGTLIASPVRTEAGTIERTTRAIGRGRLMNGSSYDSWADAGLSAAFTQQLTWFALLDIDSHTAGSFIIGNVEAASTGYNHGLYINNSKFPTFFVKTGGVGASAIGSAVITAVGPVAMVGTYDGATMVVHSHTYSTGLYQRATTAKTGNLDTTTFPVTVGRWNGGFGGMAGTFYLGGVIRGVWTDTQAREFFANPWQVFAPRSIWVPVSSGSAPATFQAAWARNANTVLVGGRL